MNLHLKTSFENIRRAPFQAMAAVSVLSITFFVTTLLVVIAYGSNSVVSYFETRPQVIAFLNADATPRQAAELQAKLEGDNRIASVSFVSKEEALEIYRSATSENPLLGELVSPSIFPSSLEFSVADLAFTEEVIAEIEKEEAIDSIGFTASIGGDTSPGEVINRLREIALYIRVGGLAIISVFVITSFLVLMVVVGMKMTTRRKEVDTLTLIGATPGFIRAPIVLEAIHYSLISALIGWVGGIVVILYATPTLVSYFDPVEVLPRSAMDFFVLHFAILGAELVVAFMIALFGSSFAVSRALRLQKS